MNGENFNQATQDKSVSQTTTTSVFPEETSYYLSSAYKSEKCLDPTVIHIGAHLLSPKSNQKALLAFFPFQYLLVLQVKFGEKMGKE